jgi:hypothetical protein
MQGGRGKDLPMADRPDKPASVPQRGSAEEPRHSPRTRADKAARQARLAAELRQNLLKRKRQQRARDGRTQATGRTPVTIGPLARPKRRC